MSAGSQARNYTPGPCPFAFTQKKSPEEVAAIVEERFQAQLQLVSSSGRACAP